MTWIKCLALVIVATILVESSVIETNPVPTSGLALIVGVVGLFALIRPIRAIGLGQRAVAATLVIASFAVLTEAGGVLQRMEADELAALKESDQTAYLARLKEIDEERWLNELKVLDPAAHAAVEAARRRETQSARREPPAPEITPEAEDPDRVAGFHCLSVWDGAHRDLKAYTKERLRNPGSFEHIETSITPRSAAQTHRVIMDYRAENGFGGMTTGRVVAVIDHRSCALKTVAFK